jgi:hypothetical protein
MISSQDGTDERLPRGGFRPERPVCPAADSACPESSGPAAGSASAGGAAAGRFPRSALAVPRWADAALRPALRVHGFRSAAAGRDASLPASAGAEGAADAGTDAAGAAGADGAGPGDAMSAPLCRPGPGRSARGRLPGPSPAGDP